jgi:hypothetical protein
MTIIIVLEFLKKYKLYYLDYIEFIHDYKL